MSRAAFHKLELESLGVGPSTRATDSTVTAENLGCIIPLVWRVLATDKEIERIGEDLFQPVFDRGENPPKGILNAVHEDMRITGVHIAEKTKMIAAAQISGILGRLNPRTVDPAFRIDSIQASLLLKVYEARFPEDVAWVKRVVKTLVADKDESHRSSEASR